MNKKEILDKVKEIFRDNFDDDTLDISYETSAVDIEDWDSFEQINLIVSMEEEFHIKFVIQEVNELKNVGDMIELIDKKLK